MLTERGGLYQYGKSRNKFDENKPQAGNRPYGSDRDGSILGGIGSRPVCRVVDDPLPPEYMKKLKTAQQRGFMSYKAGFTLMEAVVAVSLVTLVSLGLFSGGLMILKMTHHNRVAFEARTLGIQLLEEMSANTVTDLATLMPFSQRTNQLQYGESVLRSVDVIGHDASRAVIPDIADAEYAEVHVNVEFFSPLTKSFTTNTFSAIVR